MHKRPLFVVSIFFILGIILAKYLPDSVGFNYIFIATLILILTCLIFFRHEKFANILLLLSVTSFAALLYVNSNIFPQNHISQFLGEEKLKVDILGITRSPALTRKPYFGRISSVYVLEVEAIKDKGEWSGVTGLAQIRIQTEKEYQYGDRLLVRGTIRKPLKMTNDKIHPSSPLTSLMSMASADARRSFNEGGQMNSKYNRKTNFDYKQYLENQNIFAIINTKEENVTILAHNYRANPIVKYAYLIREKLKNQFIQKMPLESGTFLCAILLGDRSELPSHIQESFRNSGTMHILAISGLHVGIVASVIIFLLKLLRFPREAYYFGTIIFLMFLSVLTGGNPPVVRATVMITVFLIGMLLGRSVDVYNSIGVAGLFILVRSPKDIFDVGFQLSFLAVLSMLYFVPKFMKLIKEDVNIYIKKFFYVPLAVSISASLGTFPLIIYYFRMFTPIAIVSNLFIVPAMFVQLVGGLCFSVLGRLPLVSDVLAQFNNILAQVIFWLADFFASLKFGHFYLG